ncbi:MAG: hypothetical protein JJE21_06510, partial [Spirochaetaceae bacterium]|nr:hypothetical protein [Spirochaetaceae bacterium]
GLIPQVNLVFNGYNYLGAAISEDQVVAVINLVIPAGANLKAANLAAFNLDIKGNSSIPAGNFVSTVSIAYTYAQ